MGKKQGSIRLYSLNSLIFLWDIDLEREVRKGDNIKILYEQRSRKGQERTASLRILAAELISADQKLTAIYFEKQKGQGNYYNLEKKPGSLLPPIPSGVYEHHLALRTRPFHPS